VKRTRILRFLLLLALLLLPDCAQKERITGSYYIPRNDLVQILTEIYLMDGITDSYKFYRMYEVNDTVDIHSAIFSKYQTDREHFDSTIKVYSAYPDILDKVYDEVLMNLNIIQDSLDMKATAKQRENVSK